MKDLLKKVWEIIGIVLTIVVFAGIVIYSLYCTVGTIVVKAIEIIQIAGGGSVLWGILLFPFFVLGVIQILRGAAFVLNHDSEKYDSKPVLYCILFFSTLVGYFAVIITAIRWVKG